MKKGIRKGKKGVLVVYDGKGNNRSDTENRKRAGKTKKTADQQLQYGGEKASQTNRVSQVP